MAFAKNDQTSPSGDVGVENAGLDWKQAGRLLQLGSMVGWLMTDLQCHLARYQPDVVAPFAPN